MEGCITALITPFIRGHIDEEGFLRNLDFQLDSGISGVLILGTTGEAMTLSAKERARVIELSVKKAKGKVPIIVGTGQNCTRSTIEFSKLAEDLGADMVSVVAPYYNKPTQEGIFRHFKTIVESLSIPLMVYNIQSRVGVNIETETLIRIAALPRVIAVKEASGNLSQAGDVVNQIPHLSLFSGDDAFTLPMMALGAKGVVSVVSNLIPLEMGALVKAALDGKFEEAKKRHYQLLPLFKAAFLEVNPVPIKEAMNLVGFPAGDYRLPLCEMDVKNREKLRHVLREMGLV